MTAFASRQILTAQALNLMHEAIAALQAVGSLVYQGTWNAAVNIPPLASGVGTKGHFYTVSVAGTTSIDGVSSWQAGDKITFNGTAWERTAAGTFVESVAGLTGLITASQLKTALGFVLADIVAALGFTPVNKAGDSMTGSLTLPGDPSTALHAATKRYVDSVAQGLSPKASCQLATTGPITLAGEQIIDGMTTNSSRVLVKNQSSPPQNGIFISNAGAWTRAPDADTWNDLVSASCFVEQGATNADTGWVCTSDRGGVLGTTAVSFVKFSNSGSITDGSQAPLFDTVRWTRNVQLPVGTNLDTILVSGFYEGQNLANKPAGSAQWGHVIVQRHTNSDLFARQEFWNLEGTPTQGWVRQRIGGAWQPWVRIFASNDKAINGDVWAAAADKVLTAERLEGASALIPISSSSPVTINWDAGINFLIEINQNIIVANPINGQPGTWRTIFLFGSGSHTVSFGNQFLGELPSLINVGVGGLAFVMIYCLSPTQFLASAKR